jgi:hypothetical protein
VEDDATHELDVEMAHAERPAHRLAAHGEDVGQQLVEHLLEPRVLALATLLRQLATAFQVRVVELVVGRLVRRGGFEGLLAKLGELVADRLVRHGFVFGFERVRGVDDRLEASDLPIVGVDETVQKSHGR